MIEDGLKDKQTSASQAMNWENDRIEDQAIPTQALLLHSYLLGDEFTKSFTLVKDLDSNTWCYNDNPQAFFIAFVFLSVANKSLAQLPKNLVSFWNYAIDTTLGHSWHTTTSSHSDTKKKLEGAYQKLITEETHYDKSVFDWCLEKIKGRIHRIVSGTERKYYDHAALLTMACTEMLTLLEKPAESSEFYLSIKQNYPRHSAFQGELRAAQT